MKYPTSESISLIGGRKTYSKRITFKDNSFEAFVREKGAMFERERFDVSLGGDLSHCRLNN